MIKEFVQTWEEHKDSLEEWFTEHHPDDYEVLVRKTIELLAKSDDYHCPDPERITEINHGAHQGTLVYVIGASGYQPSTHWYVRVDYGSCSGCDTLERIAAYSLATKPTEKQVKQYMTLALHIIQRMKQMDDMELE